MNISEKKTNSPLIDRILIIGLSQEDFAMAISPKTKNTALVETIKSLKIKILEEYKSNDLRELPKENYKENLPTFCMSDGIKCSESPKDFTLHSFSLITSTAKRKHCTCLSYYETYETKDKLVKIYILKAVCIVSGKPIYDTHKELLISFHSVQVNHKENRSNTSEKLNYIYLRDKSKSYTVLKEYSVLEFYFSFVLNSLKYPKEESSFYVNYIGNNMGKKCFLKYFTNSKQSFPLADYDMTKLLEYFNVEDLIKIYMGMLMEYKLILIFDDYETINNLIFSIVNLLFPLKWKFPIVSFIASSLIDTLEAPFGIVIGLHSQYMNILSQKINQDLMVDETLIYNMQNKNFVFFPKNFPELPLKIINELRSSIYLVLSEKLSLTSDSENEDTELFKIFPTNAYKKLDPIVYLNLKTSAVFFNLFIELIKNLESSIYFNKVKSIKSTKDRVPIHEIFDSTKFINDRDFHNDKKYSSFVEQFSKTIMFMDFLEKYIKHSDKHPRYKHIKTMITTLNSKDNGKAIIRDMNREYIKSKIIAYYNFKYLSLEEALKIYPENLKIVKKQTTYDNSIWTPLDNKKITNFLLHLDKILMNEKDDKIKDNNYRKLYVELSRSKDTKQNDHFSDEDILADQIQGLNINDMRTKSHLEALSKGRNFFNSKPHKQSTSLNMESQLNNSMLNRIIQTDNKVENYYFNNINISSDQFSKDIAKNIGMSIDSNNNKLLNSYAPNRSHFNIGNSVNSLRNVSSTTNSMTASANANDKYANVSSFTADMNARNNYSMNLSTNTIADNDILRIKKKALNAQGNLIENIYKKKDNINTANKVGEMLKGFKIMNKNRAPVETEVVCSNKKDKSVRDTNLSMNIGPSKQIRQGTHKNSASIKIGGVVNKLAGDEEFDLFFSGNEEEN